MENLPLTQLVQIAAIAIILIGGYYLKKLVGAQKLKDIKNKVEMAVKAAQQLFPDTGTGKQRKEYVLKVLSEYGINMTEEQLDTIIEAFVWEVNQITESKEPLTKLNE